MPTQECTALYRGMRKDTTEWIYGCLIKRKDRHFIATNDSLDFMVIDPDGTAKLKLIEVIPETVGGYTTVNDMNDIKVFCGDILENIITPEAPFKNVYHNLVVMEDGSYFADGFCNIEGYEFQYCRVIGNVYQNPELLDFDCE